MRFVIVGLLILGLCVPCFAQDITLTIPDEKMSMVIESICANYNYQATIQQPDGSMIPNPETKAQFAKKIVAFFIKENVKAYKANQAAQEARNAALNNPDNSVDIQ